MPRTAAFLLALTLAASPDAAILCHALCAPKADVTKACDHDGAGLVQIAAAGDCCDGMVAGDAAPRSQAVPREASTPNGEYSMPGLRDDFVRSTTASRLGYEPGRGRSLDNRPLPTILRI